MLDHPISKHPRDGTLWLGTWHITFSALLLHHNYNKWMAIYLLVYMSLLNVTDLFKMLAQMNICEIDFQVLQHFIFIVLLVSEK